MISVQLTLDFDVDGGGTVTDDGGGGGGGGESFLTALEDLTHPPITTLFPASLAPPSLRSRRVFNSTRFEYFDKVTGVGEMTSSSWSF